MTQKTIDATTVQPGIDQITDEQLLCAEVDRILTAAYSRIVADAVAIRPIRPVLTTVTHALRPTNPTATTPVSVPRRHRRGWDVFANQRAPPHS